MWNFASPRIVFGDGALDALCELSGKRALIVTDPFLARMGVADKIALYLKRAGIECALFDRVESDPSLETARLGREMALEVQPDWIVGLGGGSPMDVSKAVWVTYEHPEMDPGEINPVSPLELGVKAHLITIPTTSGTGSEVTWAIVLTDRESGRKLGLGNQANMPTIAVVDPDMAMSMPAGLTADTGMDALVHAVEGYTCTWHTEFTDGLCVQAFRTILPMLPRAYRDGTDREARTAMHHSATLAGLGFGNSMASMAHALGHTLGGLFHAPHGRAVGLMLPYTIEYIAREAPERFGDLSRMTAAPQDCAESDARALAERIRGLARELALPTAVAELGIAQDAFDAALDQLGDNAFNDASMMTSARIPSYEELVRLWQYAYAGRPIDF